LVEKQKYISGNITKYVYVLDGNNHPTYVIIFVPVEPRSLLDNITYVPADLLINNLIVVSASDKPSNEEAGAQASLLGYRRTGGISHGSLIYENPKAKRSMRYISPDNTTHIMAEHGKQPIILKI
jgi:hypothetical protein